MHCAHEQTIVWTMMGVMDEDPGWNFTLRSIATVVAPQLALNRSGTNSLATTRVFFTSFSTMLVGITVLLFVVAGSVEVEEPRSTLSTSVVVVYGVVSLIAGRRVKRRLDCTSSSALATSYVQRFFLRLAFAESSALIGFTIAIGLGPTSVYFIGLAFAVLGFALLAPTRRNLAADQRNLTGDGCQRSLTRALLDQSAAHP